MPDGQICPICGTSIRENPRYPRYLCRNCTAHAKDSDGRGLSFSNVGISGGYLAHYADTGELYASHDCYVDGAECRADEARFGGIVIETKV